MVSHKGAFGNEICVDLALQIRRKVDISIFGSAIDFIKAILSFFVWPSAHKSINFVDLQIRQER